MTLGAGDIVDAAEGRTVGRRFSKRSIIFRRKKRVDSRGSLLALRGENDIKNKRFMDQNNLQLKFPQNTETNTSLNTKYLGLEHIFEHFRTLNTLFSQNLLFLRHLCFLYEIGPFLQHLLVFQLTFFPFLIIVKMDQFHKENINGSRIEDFG